MVLHPIERAVQRLLDDPKWAKWSDMRIAEHCGVSTEQVRVLRPKPAPSSRVLEIDAPPAPATRTVTRGGTTYEQNVTNIGRRNAPAEPT